MKLPNSVRAYTLLILVSTVALGLFALVEYTTARNDQNATLDSKLRAVALAARSIVGDHYQARPLEAGDVSQEEEYALAQALTELAVVTDLEFVYSMVQAEGVIRFTASSLEPEEQQGGDWQRVYWTTYPEAADELKQVFATGEPRFSNYTDRWGTYRSYFMPVVPEVGRPFVIGVDVDLAQLTRIERYSLVRALLALSIIVGILALWFVTDRRLKRRLYEHSRRTELALAGSPVGIWESNLKTNQIYVAPAFLESLGYSGNAMPDSTEALFNLIHPEDKHRVFDVMEQAANSQYPDPHPQNYEFRVRTPEGVYLWLRSEGRTTHWQRNGKPHMRAGVLENIDRLKRVQINLEQSQRSLRQRELFLDSLLSSVPDVIGFKNREGTYLMCNPALAQMMGRTREEIIGKTDYELMPFHIAESLRENDLKALSGDDIVRVEEWIAFASDNRSRLIETLKIRMHNQLGDEEGVLSIGRDITEKYEFLSEQKRITADLAMEKERAELANKSKSMFLANMSHEIRTPLNAILGYAQLLAADKTVDRETRERLEYIHEAGVKLLGLINDILDLSKIEANKLSVKLAPFNLYDELQTVVQLVKGRANAKSLSLVRSITLPEDAVVESDRQKIAQILLNLLSNAVKFTDVGEVELICEARENSVYFAVRDTGSGLSDREIADLFNPFTQGDSGVRAGQGTGLGLSLSQRLAQLLGGEILVRSKLGKGSLFSLELPLVVSRQHSPQNHGMQMEPVTLEPGSNVRVMVVDDDYHSRKILQENLAGMGFTVEVLDSGEQALEYLKSDTVAAVFTDIRMGEISGIDLLKWVKQQPRLQGVPVIAVSASSLEHERSFYMQIGFDDFISKPLVFDEVTRSVVRHFGDYLVNKAQLAQNTDAPGDAGSTASIDVDDLNRLQALGEASATGDITRVSELLNGFSRAFKSCDDFQRLHEAVQEYDFYRVEKLVEKFQP